jgi:hypothetical protein
MPLEEHYSGDSAWTAYAGTWADYWRGCNFKPALLESVHSDLLLAQTIYGVVGDSALRWLEQPVPALDGRTPVSCLSTLGGVHALRECLLRAPV